MAAGNMPAIYKISGDVGDGSDGAVAATGSADPRDPRNMLGFAAKYQATQNTRHVRNDMGDAVREEDPVQDFQRRSGNLRSWRQLCVFT